VATKNAFKNLKKISMVVKNAGVPDSSANVKLKFEKIVILQPIE
jgi:hypothetical protein